MRHIFQFLEVDNEVSVDTNPHKNEAAYPKSKILMRILNESSIFKAQLKRFLPLIARRRFKEFLIEKNLQAYDVAPKIDPQTESALRERYVPEIKDLEKL